MGKCNMPPPRPKVPTQLLFSIVTTVGLPEILPEMGSMGAQLKPFTDPMEIQEKRLRFQSSSRGKL